MGDEWLTVSEVARLHKVTDETVRSWCRDPELREELGVLPRKHGRAYVIRAAQALQFVPPGQRQERSESELKTE